MLNSYPEKFINRYINSQRKKWFNLKNNIPSEITEKEAFDYTKTIILPSFDYCTKELKQFLEKKCNLKTVFYSPFKLDKIIKVNKDKSKILDNKCVVYKINCDKCECCYVGQTKRLLSTRRQEHEDNFYYKERYHNVITKHIKQHQFDVEKHDMRWDSVEILHKEKNWKKRCVAEMIYIKKQNNSLNKITDIDALPSVYTAVLNKM